MTEMVAKDGKGNLSGRSSGTENWIFGRLGKRLSSCNLVMNTEQVNSLKIITVTMMMMEVMRVRMVFTESETMAHWR